MGLKVALACDHAGFSLKEAIKAFLSAGEAVPGAEVTDLGTFSDAPVDYPDTGVLAAEGVARGRFDRAVLVCGTGIGMCMVANKVPGVRAALCHDEFSARASRQHNDANVLTLGARVVGAGLALEVVRAWLATGFEGGRHARRLEKLRRIEERYAREAGKENPGGREDGGGGR
ncbi:MAG: ribose 5-phosphate isomerase B [Acetobacteraceae bacterium]|nr:ribose 5-phosphate isomerase B [Acetobacteraceae bacterium]